MLRDVDPVVGEAELAYWVGVPLWGRGLATHAARWAVGFAFLDLGLFRVRAHCLAGNAASLRVLAKAGFHETGRSINDGSLGEKFCGEEFRHLARAAAP
jgi:RimJ/RimL family protein N-acetyltransferase